jgi:hypothetical protein
MKVWTYLIIFVAMMLFLEFVGIHTALNGTLGLVGITINKDTSLLETGDISQSTFWTKSFGAGVGVLMLVISAGGIIAGLFGKQFDTRLVILPFITGVLALFSGTTWIIVQYAMLTGESWLIGIVATIFLPLGVGFVFSLIEFFGGTD